VKITTFKIYAESIKKTKKHISVGDIVYHELAKCQGAISLPINCFISINWAMWTSTAFYNKNDFERFIKLGLPF
jgi:hypothetical protein